MNWHFYLFIAWLEVLETNALHFFNSSSIYISIICVHFYFYLSSIPIIINDSTPGQPNYMVMDGDIPCTKKHEQIYTYEFNVCGSVTDYNIEEECRAELVDSRTQESKIPTAGVIQINRHGHVNETNNDWCYVAGYFNEAATTVRLLDTSDPTKGIQLRYLGDFCNGGKQRTVFIHLECADVLAPVPTHAYEYSSCEYTIYMPSVYGCPLECPVAHRAICGGQGHCAYDPDAQQARCFCNEGYGGPACTITGSALEYASHPGYSPAMLGLTITLGIIIAALVISIIMMIRQVAAYRNDIANYQVLKGGDEDMSTSQHALSPHSNSTTRNPMNSGGNGSFNLSSMANSFSSAISPNQGGGGTTFSPGQGGQTDGDMNGGHGGFSPPTMEMTNQSISL